MVKKQFVIIGLGRFGASVAKTLYGLGNDVLAIDKDAEVVFYSNDGEKEVYTVGDLCPYPFGSSDLK